MRHRAERKGGKQGAYVRVCSAQDEVLILEGLTGHVKTHGSPRGPCELRDVLQGHILDKKEFAISRDKYRSMRAAAASRVRVHGNAKDLRKYEIFDKIWGDSAPLHNGEKMKGNTYHAPRPRVRRVFKELRDVYPHLALTVGSTVETDGQEPLKKVIELIDDAKARDLKEKVKKQWVLKIKAELDHASV
ncbi:hypothetical protein ZWY2020_026531 [Hordeum vulgare]|nr:hypothetical protein ZWY2020_026531 [Hordeum vulgare]